MYAARIEHQLSLVECWCQGGPGVRDELALVDGCMEALHL